MDTNEQTVSTFRRFRGSRVIAIALAIVLIGIIAAVLSFLSITHSALPQLDGSLSVPGLNSPVTVIRDLHGIPTIEAATLDDLFFAQGYVTAQDRLFQMDGMRRFAAGELSEILGPDLLKHDREQRIYGLREAARKAAQIQSQEDRAHFEAYARGVNAFMDSHRRNLPLEFRVLGYTPRPWTPVESMLIAAQMVEDLSTGPREALTREKILNRLGPKLTADLYVNISIHDHPPSDMQPPVKEAATIVGSGPEPGRLDGSSRVDQNLISGLDPWRDATSSSSIVEPPVVIGSNNWAVSGAHTVSGKPLLSNDMHLAHQIPNLWYQVHLHCRGYDVAGVALPGLPYVIVGHNQRIAWGFTNVGPTVEDAYIENLNSDGKYLTPAGWKATEHRLETIRVKGKPDVAMLVRLTRHGPIIAELIPGETRQISLRWTLYDGIHNPFFAVNSASNWTEFRKAFSAFDAPGQNVVYADVDGNIGYQATGKIPIRTSGDGSLPEDGSNDEHEWISYVPFEEMPSVFNPPAGVIATANGRITPDGYPYSISSQWEAPWRTQRIYSVLNSNTKVSAPDMLALQMDIYSEFDHLLAQKLAEAVGHAQSPSPRAKQAAQIMRAWDGRLTKDSAAPTLELLAQNALIRLLLEPKLGAAPTDPPAAQSNLSWRSYRWMNESVWLESIVQQRPERWLPETYSSYDELLAAAVEASVSTQLAPADLASWRWGKFHPVEIQHPIFGRIPFLRRWSGPGLQEQSGNGYTVKAASRTHGPSERMTVDLGNLDQSTMNLVTGEAGNLLSPYYMDQWKAWYEGSAIPFLFSRPAIERAKKHQLTLTPAH
ncbi:MAG: penicillin acylase family protein [Acidobacteriota bacterium]|nr:penicillin acylase family protein [Acidobacteriota bacterium]